MVPWPAMTYGSSNGGMLVSPCSTCRRAASALAVSKSCPTNLTVPPRRDTFLCLMAGVPEGMDDCSGDLQMARRVGHALSMVACSDNRWLE